MSDVSYGWLLRVAEGTQGWGSAVGPIGLEGGASGATCLSEGSGSVRDVLVLELTTGDF